MAMEIEGNLLVIGGLYRRRTKALGFGRSGHFRFVSLMKLYSRGVLILLIDR